MKVAVVKPDHLGDLVLSVPALAAITNRYPDTTLFVSRGTRDLARFLFPDVEIRLLNLPHLQKFGRVNDAASPTDLRDFDLVYFLRKDHSITIDWVRLATRNAVLVDSRPDVHETLSQARAVAGSGLDCPLPQSLSGVTQFPRDPRRVGLCISAGFYANRWHTLRWVEVAKLLESREYEVFLIGGPNESGEAQVICGLAGLDPKKRMIVGTQDFAGFLQRVETLDVVIGSDSGTAHICSLATAVVSMFGGSPFVQFCPFGIANRVMTRQVACAPCLQYDEVYVNMCVTTECMGDMSAPGVLQAIEGDDWPPGTVIDLAANSGTKLFFGPSHNAVSPVIRGEELLRKRLRSAERA